MRSGACVMGVVAAVGLLAAAAGCTVKRSEPITPGAGLAVGSGAVSVDPAIVPLVSGACAEGQVVTRAADGWECAPPGGPVGPTGPTGATGPTGPDCDTTALATLQAAVQALQADVAALKASQCPAGFDYDGSEAPVVLCQRQAFGATDSMVKVGNFWIDRYEASECPGSGDPGAVTGYGTTSWACSRFGAVPRTSVTWFQAAAMCANAGKRLCTNAEWQTAASGTPDPGAFPGVSGACGASSPSTTQCNTCASGPGLTGRAVDCKSRFGAYDMIGNCWEWVAEWFQAGQAVSGFTDGKYSTPWPAGYGDTCGTSPNETSCDGMFNLDGRASSDNGATYQDGLPAAATRGGAWQSAEGAGAYAFNLSLGPTAVNGGVGARCCIGQ